MGLDQTGDQVANNHSSLTEAWQHGSERLSDHEKQNRLVWWNQDWTLRPLFPMVHGGNPAVQHGGGSIVLFCCRDWKTGQDRGEYGCRKTEQSLWKSSPECSGSHPGAKVYISTTQWLKVNRQENAVVASGELCKSPEVAKPQSRPEPNKASLDRSENGCAPLLLTPPGWARTILLRRMGETSRRKVCRILSKKSWGCHFCQSCFN